MRTAIISLTMCFSIALSGCATIDALKARSKALSKNGGTKVSKTTKRKKVSNKSFATKFKRDEIPHTLLKKPVAAGKLTSKFGYRLNPKGIPFPKKHKGIDYAAPKGTAIYASGVGVIQKKYVSTSYGNRILIRHANGFVSTYSHMNKFAAKTDVGLTVKRGQIIGEMGNTGKSTASHLHYELLYNGKYVDPLFN